MSDEHVDYRPPERTPWNEGKTLAAWMTTWILLVGAVLVTVGFIFANIGLIVAGGVVIVLSLVVGKVLAILGYGKGGAATAKRDSKALAAGQRH